MKLAPLLLQVFTLAKSPAVEIDEFGGDAIGKIAGAAIVNKTIVTTDETTRTIYTFDLQGKLLSRFGRAGRGPGEFLSMIWLGTCGTVDTVFIWDRANARISKIRENEIVEIETGHPRTILSISCAAPDKRVAVSWPMGSLEKLTPIGPHRGKSEVRLNDSIIGVYLGSERYRYPTTDAPRVFGKELLVATNKRRIFVGNADSFYVDIYDIDGKCVGALSHRVSIKPVTDMERNAYYRELTRLEASRGKVFRKNTVPEELFAKTLPAYDKLVATDDHVWVRESNIVKDSTDWLIFDNNGEFKSNLRVPRQLEILAVKGEMLLGKWTDEDGAESLRRYRLATNPQGRE